MFPFKDPGLPVELLPPGWKGRQAHDLFLAGFGLLRAPAVDHYRQVLAERRGEAPSKPGLSAQPKVCGAPPQPRSVTDSGPSDATSSLASQVTPARATSTTIERDVLGHDRRACRSPAAAGRTELAVLPDVGVDRAPGGGGRAGRSRCRA